ncbi:MULTISPECIES: hypothetical protein [unclassified Sinorhizobium]|uniref:hypothetical protein n=1 Tax=unclassified Sinorhizobium TaxID=2613772 RepID=UPI0035246FD0
MNEGFAQAFQYLIHCGPLGTRSSGGRLTRGVKIACIAAVVSPLLPAPAVADCWSALKSPEWPRLAKTFTTVKLCEQLPGGPDRTKKFEVTAVDVCTAPNGVSITAKASLSCEAGSGGLLKLPALNGSAVAKVTLDIGACRITESHVSFGGAIGEALETLPEIQNFTRSWAQSRLSELCGLQ